MVFLCVPVGAYAHCVQGHRRTLESLSEGKEAKIEGGATGLDELLGRKCTFVPHVGFLTYSVSQPPPPHPTTAREAGHAVGVPSYSSEPTSLAWK